MSSWSRKGSTVAAYGAFVFVTALVIWSGCDGSTTMLQDGGEEHWISGDVIDGGQDETGVQDGGSDPAYDVDPWQDAEHPNPLCEAFEGLDGERLRQALHDSVDGHQALSYDEARYQLFSFVSNQDGEVDCVYTGFRIQTWDVPDANVMNTEHTWCQSWGADGVPAKSDLNHLFPTKSTANSVRSNYPFGEVLEADWSEGGSSRGLDGWGDVVFEPRDRHKGDAARAIFYFAVRYEKPVPDRMEQVLRRWNAFDPPDDWEIERAGRIEQLQLRRNPFVDCPWLVDEIADF